MNLRAVVFFLLIGAALVPGLLILFAFPDAGDVAASELGKSALTLVAQLTPAVAADANVAGFATPLAAAGALAFLAPAPTQRFAFALAVVAAAAGWGVYLWLSTSLVDQGFRDGVLIYLDQQNPAAESRAKLVIVQAFASTMRALFLALGAALIGARLRPGAPPPAPAPAPAPAPEGPQTQAGLTGAAKAAAALILTAAAAFAASPTVAGEVRIDARGDHFQEKIEVKLDPGAAPEEIKPGPDGIAAFTFGTDVFAASAYAERIIVITWTPKLANEPANSVAPFTVELPIVLRKWRAAEAYYIRARPMAGIGLRNRDDLESLSIGALWTKALASLQQQDHFRRLGQGKSAEARRTLNTAVDALVEIMKASKSAWLRPPLGLKERLEQSFEGGDSVKLRSLAVGLGQLDRALWQDALLMDQRLNGANCEVVAGTFEYLDGRKAQNAAAYEQELGAQPNLLAIKRAAAEKACPGS